MLLQVINLKNEIFNAIILSCTWFVQFEELMATIFKVVHTENC